MSDFMSDDFNRCCEIAMMVRKYCYDNITGVEFPYNSYRWFNFKIVLPSNRKVHSISVSIPSDANMDIHLNKDDIIDLNAINWIVYETALYDYSGKIIYDDEFYGDDGINRFYSINELIDEIKNIIERVKEH